MDQQSKEVMLNDLMKRLEQMDATDLVKADYMIRKLEASVQDGRHLFGHFLGVSFDRFHSEHIVTMDLGAHNENTHRVAHGGALFSLADTALGNFIITQIDPKDKLFTLEMKMNYIKKGEGKKLTAKPQIIHLGRTTVVGECRIEDDTNDLVAIALGTFYRTHYA